MRQAPDMIGEKIAKKHIQLTEELLQLLENDAFEKTGGNVSWLVRNILRIHYGIKLKTKAKN